MQHATSPHHPGLQLPLSYHPVPIPGNRTHSYTGAEAGSVRRKTSGNANAGYGAPPPTPIVQVSGGPGPLPLSPNHLSHCTPLPTLIRLNIDLCKDAGQLNGPPSPSPWDQMGHTYSWVVEQELLRDRRHVNRHHGGHQLPGQGYGVGQPHLNPGFKQQMSGKSHIHGKKPITEEWVMRQQVFQCYSPIVEDSPQIRRSSNARRYTTGHGGHIPSRKDRERDRDSCLDNSMPPPRRGKTYDEVVYRYEVDADRWMRHEQDSRESRRMAEERQSASAKVRVQEELKRIEERIQKRRAEERKILQESRPKIWVSTKERERREKEKRKPTKNVIVSVTESWERYEEGWKALSNPNSVANAVSTERNNNGGQDTSSSSAPLKFADIPWPLTVPPTSVEDITPTVIAGFLLSPAHSRAIGVKERLRSAQLRWHPDRFRRLLPRVEESDKAAVEEGAGIVARCLNELMEREKNRS